MSANAKKFVQPLGRALSCGTDGQGLQFGQQAFRGLLEGGVYRAGVRFIDSSDYGRRIGDPWAPGHSAPSTSAAPGTFRSLLSARGYPTINGFYQIPYFYTEAQSEVEEMRACPPLLPVFPAMLDDAGELWTLGLGWIYIFVNGHLWREIHSDGVGTYRDVNLALEQGQDVRISRYTQAQPSLVVLPQMDDLQVEVAFSRFQWSWDFIRRLGGMDPQDPRYIRALQRRGAEEEGLRARRCQRIPLTEYTPSQGLKKLRETYLLPIETACKKFNKEKKEQNGVAQLPWLEEEDVRNSELPILALYDPIGSAQECNRRYRRERVRFAKWSHEHGRELTIGTLVSQVITAEPELAERVNRISLDMFLRDYEQRKASSEERIDHYARRLLRLLDSRNGPEALATAFLDFELEATQENPRKHRLATEGLAVWADLLEEIGCVGAGLEWLSQQLERPDDLTWTFLRILGAREVPVPENLASDPSKKTESAFEQTKSVLEITDKIKTLTESLLNGLARPFAYAERHWQGVRPALERMYGVRIATESLDYEEWQRLQGSRRAPALSGAVEVRFVPPGQGTVVRVIRVDGVAVLAQQGKELLDRVPAKLLVALQVISLGFSWEDLCKAGRQGEVDLWDMSKVILETIALGFSATSAFLSDHAADVIQRKALKAGLEKVGGAFGVAANVFAAVSDFQKAQKYVSADELGAAASYGVSSAGGAVAAAGAAMLLLSGPVGWAWALVGIGTLLAVGGNASLAWTQPTPIELWLKHCSFGRYPYGRGLPDASRYVAWGQDLALELAAFHRIVYAVQVKVLWYVKDDRSYGKTYKHLAERVENDLGGMFSTPELTPFDVRPNAHWSNGILSHPGLPVEDQGLGLHVIIEVANYLPASRLIVDGVMTPELEASVSGVRPNVNFERHARLTRTRGKAGQEIFSWYVPSTDLPRHAAALTVRVSYDPYGNGSALIPGDQPLVIRLPHPTSLAGGEVFASKIESSYSSD